MELEGNSKSKCIFFFFLSPKIATIASTAVMIGITAYSYNLNIMINEEIGPFLLYVARIFGICVLVSLVVYIVGILIDNMILIKQYTTIYAVYIFFSLSCFCCNFITLIFGNCYRESYNLFTVYLDIYKEKVPETTLKNDEIKSLVKRTFYIGSLLHVLSLGLMIYYYMVTSKYVEEKCDEQDEYGQKYISSKKSTSAFQSISKSTV